MYVAAISTTPVPYKYASVRVTSLLGVKYSIIQPVGIVLVRIVTQLLLLTHEQWLKYSDDTLLKEGKDTKEGIVRTKCSEDCFQ